MATNLAARGKLNGILNAAKAGDWPAINSNLRDANEAVRAEFVAWAFKAAAGDAHGHVELATKRGIQSALQYLNRMSNPSVAVRAATIILILSKEV